MLVDSTINILFCIDNRYIVQAATAISSILTSNHYNHIRVFVAMFERDDSIFVPLFDHLKLFFNFDLEMIYLDDDLFKGLPTTRNYSKSIYSRIVFDRFVDKNVERLLYLDADIIVRGDLRELWETNLNGTILGAARDFFRLSPSDIGFKQEEPYFNSGVLLIDRNNWNQHGCEKSVLDVLHKSGPTLDWMDQDALNIVLRGRTTIIEPKYNFQPRCADVPARFLGMTSKEYQITRRSPIIVHYTTSLKPWNAGFKVHYSNLYFEVQNDSGFMTKHLLPAPTPRNISDQILLIKTKLRWYFPKSFSWIRSMLRPEAAAMMYRASSEP